MKGPKSIIVTVTVLVVVALVATAGFLLFQGMRELGETERNLEQKKTEMIRYFEKDPFPSPANVKQEEENVTLLDSWYDQVIAILREGQISQEEKSPSTFMRLVGETRNDLLRQAHENNSSVQEDFAFGFDRYFGSEADLPAPADVAKLTQQLTLVASICSLLFEEKVVAMQGVEREDVEADSKPDAEADSRPAVRRRLPRAGRSTAQQKPPQKEDDVYERSHFAFDFIAKEKTLWAVLNRLIKHDHFIVVTSIELTKQGPDVIEPRGQEAGRKPSSLPSEEEATAVTRTPSRRERLMSGPELEAPMKVRMELDVYNFKGV